MNNIFFIIYVINIFANILKNKGSRATVGFPSSLNNRARNVRYRNKSIKRRGKMKMSQRDERHIEEGGIGREWMNRIEESKEKRDEEPNSVYKHWF
jgi:hypothetical protein